MITDEEVGIYILPLAIFHSIVTVTGVIGNIIMCIITVRAKNLHTACHILIGLTCLSDAMHGSAHFPFLFALYSNTKWILQRNCYFVLLMPAFGNMMGLCLLLNLGVDRLIAVLAPTFYRNNQRNRLYMVLHLILPVVFCSVWIVLAWFERTDEPVMCVIPQFFEGVVQVWSYVAMVFTIVTILVYMVVYLKLKTSKLSKSAKSVFKSIFVTVLLVFFGWLTSQLIVISGGVIGAEGNTLFLFRSYAGVPVNFACSCNIFVFYFNSTDYKIAIRKHVFRMKRHPVHFTQNGQENSRTSPPGNWMTHVKNTKTQGKTIDVDQ